MHSNGFKSCMPYTHTLTGTGTRSDESERPGQMSVELAATLQPTMSYRIHNGLNSVAVGQPRPKPIRIHGEPCEDELR